MGQQLPAIFFWLHVCIGLAVVLLSICRGERVHLFLCIAGAFGFGGGVIFVVIVFKWGLLVRLW